MTENGWNKPYFCKGENYGKRGVVGIGFVGDTKTLADWISICFPGYEMDYVKNYFKDFSPGDVVKYIHESVGIRLVRGW